MGSDDFPFPTAGLFSRKLSVGVVSALILYSGLTACGSEPASRVEVAESTPVYMVPAVSSDRRRQSVLELETDLILGQGRGEDTNYVFYRPRAVAVDDEGRIYVLDRGLHHVQVFDAEGTYLASLGRRGEGPGELQQPSGLAVLEDRVIVTDVTGRKMSAWSTEEGFDFVGDSALELYNPSTQLYPLQDGTFVAGFLVFDPELRSLKANHDYIKLARIGRAGETLNVYRELEYLSESLAPRPRPRIAATPEGDVYITGAAEYAILAFDAEGREKFLIRTAEAVDPLPEEVVDQTIARLQDIRPDRTRDDYEWPESLPKINNLAIDGRGRLYVFRSYREAGRTTYPVDVFSPDGELLFSGESIMQNIHAARGEFIYRLFRDTETEEVLLGRFRINEGVFGS